MSEKAPVEKAIEVIRPGDFAGPTIESEIHGVVLSPFTGNKHKATYEVAGPAGTDLTAIQYDNDAPGDRSIHVAYHETRRVNPRNRDYKLVLMFKSAGPQPVSSAHLFTVQDEDGVLYGTFRTYITDSRWYLNLFDVNGLEHNSYWESAGAGWADDTWYHCEWDVKRDNDRANLFVNGDSKTTEKLNQDLSSLGSINPMRPTVLIGGSSNQSSANTRYHGTISDIAIGKKNYVWASPV